MSLNADFIEHYVSPAEPFMAGEPATITILLQNTSDSVYDTWHKSPQVYSGPSDIRFDFLRAINANAINIASNSVFDVPCELLVSASVMRGEQTYIYLSFNTPSEPGDYTYQWQMCTVHYNGLVIGGNPYFVNFGELVTFTIHVIGRPDAELVSNTFPTDLLVAQRGTALITLKNTGPWTWDYTYRIEAINTDATYFSKIRYYIPVDRVIEPGEDYTFQIPLRAPAYVGSYNPQYRMWGIRSGNFGDIASKIVEVTAPMSDTHELNEYRWIDLTARRSTKDISWQYEVNIRGTDMPPTFGRLSHIEDGHCAILGEPVEYSIDYDVPGASVNMAAYSYGYFISNRLPWYHRQSRAGADIKSWQMAQSNQTYIQGRTEEISTYENPSHYIARILFHVNDSTGDVDTTRPGPYGLWPGRIEPVPNWGLSAGYSGFDSRHPTTEEPYQIEKKQFVFDGDTAIDVINEVSEHCHMIYLTRFEFVDDEWREYFYWVPKFGIALGWLGVDQTPITITPTTYGLIGSPGLSASIVLEQSYNAVWVEACRKKDSAWFYKYLEGSGVVAGLEIARPLFYRTYDLLPNPSGSTWSSSISTSTNFGPGGASYGTVAEDANAQALVDERANQLLSLLEYEIPTYTVSFKGQYFELYQVLLFAGFTGLEQFNGIEMQIIDIQYEYHSAGDGGHSVTVTCAPKAQLQASGKFQSVIDEIRENYEKMKESIDNSTTDNKLSIILSTYSGGSMCNAQLRSTGQLIKTRTYGYRTASG
jgi:hypothetical protein